MVLKKLLEKLPQPPTDPLARAGVKPGLYHWMREAGGTFTRFHLRVDSTGYGLLSANATAAARLRPSGVIIAKGILEGQDDQVIVEQLAAVFQGVDADSVAGDLERVRTIIASLDCPGDNYPILNLADPSFSPELAPLDRPLGADIPLARPERIVPLLDRLWQLGIPHVTFIAGENPDAAALVRAVERAEDLGMIAGVRARASQLVEGSLIHDLAMAGVDHVDVLYLSSAAQIHDALAGPGDHTKARQAMDKVHEEEVCPVAEAALVESTLETIEETLEELTARSVTTVAFWAVAAAEGRSAEGAVSADALIQAAQLIEETADEQSMRHLWYPPVRFDPESTLADQVRRGPRCSGDHAVRVEPDGSVILARGPFEPVGNLVSDPWETIRRHERYVEYRRRVQTDTHCDDCPGLAVCAADCPRHPDGWAQVREEG